MNTERVTGYILLVIGVGMVIYATWSVYRVFTGQVVPPSVIRLEAKPLTIPLSTSVPGLEAEPVELDFLPVETIALTTNMAVHLLLMGFLSLAGGRLANIGAGLLRPVRVYLKESRVLEQLKPEEAGQ